MNNEHEHQPTSRVSLRTRLLGYFLPYTSVAGRARWSPDFHLRHARRYISRNGTTALVLLALAAAFRGMALEVLGWSTLITGCIFACMGAFMLGALKHGSEQTD